MKQLSATQFSERSLSFVSVLAFRGLSVKRQKKRKRKAPKSSMLLTLILPQKPVTPTEWRIFWWQSCRFLATPCWLGGLANISDAVHTTSKLDDIQSPPGRKDPLCEYTIITSSLPFPNLQQFGRRKKGQRKALHLPFSEEKGSNYWEIIYGMSKQGNIEGTYSIAVPDEKKLVFRGMPTPFKKRNLIIPSLKRGHRAHTGSKSQVHYSPLYG